MKRILCILFAVCAAVILIPQMPCFAAGQADQITSVTNRKIEGVVVDESGEPLMGATIVILGTNMGTTADIDGRFCFSNAPDAAILVCSYIGFETQTKVAKSNFVTFVMKEPTPEPDPEPTPTPEPKPNN